MLRDIDLDKVSDGKLYSSNDMAKTDCNGCKGCSSCCRGMGSSIVLDPLDAYRLCTGLKKSFEELLSTCLELNVVDGIILPNPLLTPWYVPHLSSGTLLREPFIPVFSADT